MQVSQIRHRTSCSSLEDLHRHLLLLLLQEDEQLQDHLDYRFARHRVGEQAYQSLVHLGLERDVRFDLIVTKEESRGEEILVDLSVELRMSAGTR